MKDKILISVISSIITALVLGVIGKFAIFTQVYFKEQIQKEVRVIIDENPNLFKGDKGPPGPPGESPKLHLFLNSPEFIHEITERISESEKTTNTIKKLITFQFQSTVSPKAEELGELLANGQNLEFETNLNEIRRFPNDLSGDPFYGQRCNLREAEANEYSKKVTQFFSQNWNSNLKELSNKIDDAARSYHPSSNEHPAKTKAIKALLKAKAAFQFVQQSLDFLNKLQ